MANINTEGWQKISQETCIVSHKPERWFRNKFMMKRLLVVIDPEDGSQKLFVKCLYR